MLRHFQEDIQFESLEGGYYRSTDKLPIHIEDIGDEILSYFSADELTRRLTPEELTRRLTPEELISGLTPEKRRQLQRLLEQ